MKLYFKIVLVFCVLLFFGTTLEAGIHLGYNPHYTMSSISDESDAASDKMKYRGIGHEFELGYSFGFTVVRFIPFVSLGQTKLAAATNDANLAQTILPEVNYKMGRLGYGVRLDLGSAIYLKVGGAIYSLTQNPEPSNNAHINGNGYFAEGGLAFNLIPFFSIVMGARYELATYKKWHTETDDGSLSDPIKQTNITGLLGIGLRI